MKAVQFDRFGPAHQVATLVDLPNPPPPGPKEVTVEMVAMGVNPSDLLTMEGQYGVKPALPFVPGGEGVGRIAAIGDGVDGLKIGDLVVPMPGSCWVEQMNVKASAVIPLPAGTDPLQAAMLKANPATAEVLLASIVPLAAGDWIIQNAANSGVGQYVVRIAKARGIKTINVVRRPEAGRIVSEAGGDIILIGGEDPKRFMREVREANGNRPIKLAFDAIGGQATNALAGCLMPGGTVVNYGLLSGEACRMDAYHLIFRDIVLRGFWLMSWFKSTPPAEIRATYARLAGQVASGMLRAEIDATYPLAKIREAMMHAGKGGRAGKVVLVTGK